MRKAAQPLLADRAAPSLLIAARRWMAPAFLLSPQLKHISEFPGFPLHLMAAVRTGQTQEVFTQ